MIRRRIVDTSFQKREKFAVRMFPSRSKILRQRA
jgi:hypothetical protein